MRLVSIGEVMIEMSGGASGAWRMGFAGDTLNTLWYARAGLDPAKDEAAYFTALGNDRFSERIAGFLDDNGIATDRIARIPGKRPGLYMIEQRDGDRQFTYWRENSAARRLAEDEGALRAAMTSADCVYLSGITLAILPRTGRDFLIDLCREARDAGTIVAFDPNIRPALWSGMDEATTTIMTMAKSASILLPSFDDEANAFEDRSPGETIARYRDAGVAEIVVKNGADAISYWGDGANGSVEAVADVEVVDATGAGDSFNGAYLGARLMGASVADAALAGRDMSARVVGVHGALAGFADPDGRWQKP